VDGRRRDRQTTLAVGWLLGGIVGIGTIVFAVSMHRTPPHRRWPVRRTGRIIANRTNVDSAAGQTPLVTLYVQLAMMGLQIDLRADAAGVRHRARRTDDTTFQSL
jgi:hypothetical protein